jgi:hypothetical protein
MARTPEGSEVALNHQALPSGRSPANDGGMVESRKIDIGHPAVAWCLVVFTFAICIWLQLWPQPPGYAVGALALMAASATFMRPTGLQKLLLIALAGALFRLETKSISRDRAAQDAVHIQEQTALNKQLDGILTANRVGLENIVKDANRKFDDTQKSFSDSISIQKSISRYSLLNLSMSEKNLNNITGGKSFAYVVPQYRSDNSSKMPLYIWNDNDETLTGVVVEIETLDYFSNGSSKIIYVGTVPAHWYRNMNFDLEPSDGSSMEGDSYRHFWITISAQNGLVFEGVQFKSSPLKNGWSFKYQVKRYENVQGQISGNHKEYILLNEKRWSDER